MANLLCLLRVDLLPLGPSLCVLSVYSRRLPSTFLPVCRDKLVPLVLKSVRSLRSSLCKVRLPCCSGGIALPAIYSLHTAGLAAWGPCLASCSCRCIFFAHLCTCQLFRRLILPSAFLCCFKLQTAIMAVADLYQSYGDALLPHTDVGGQAKPLTSLLAQVGCGRRAGAGGGSSTNGGAACID